MMITMDKLVALGLAVVYALVAALMGGIVVLPGLAFLLLPALGLIWFAEELGEFTGYVGRGGTVDQASPPLFIAAFGWLLLIGLPIYGIFFGGDGP